MSQTAILIALIPTYIAAALVMALIMVSLPRVWVLRWPAVALWWLWLPAGRMVIVPWPHLAAWGIGWVISGVWWAFGWPYEQYAVLAVLFWACYPIIIAGAQLHYAIHEAQRQAELARLRREAGNVRA